MKKTIFILIFTIIQLTFSQQKGIIYYGYIESLSNGDSKGIDYNAYMVFNNDLSYYVTAKDSLEKPEKINERKTYINKNEKSGTIHLGMKVSKQGDQVVNSVSKKTLWSNFLSRKQFYMKEDTPRMNWKITDEKKKIGKFICKKAITDFRGRNYTAWFTPEIAVQFGPWKLNGLPGLILEAYDNKNNVFWYFKSIEYPSNINEKVKYLSIPKGFKINTYQEFKEFQKEQIQITIDKQKIVQKVYPDIVFIEPNISEVFIECE